MRKMALAAALAGTVGGTALLSIPQPAAAAEPHRLQRSDRYGIADRGGPLGDCILDGSNTLLEDGTAFVNAQTRGGTAGDENCAGEVHMEISYVDTSGTPVSFRIVGWIFVRAELEAVDSELEISYHAEHAWSTSPTYSLPK